MKIGPPSDSTFWNNSNHVICRLYLQLLITLYADSPNITFWKVSLYTRGLVSRAKLEAVQTVESGQSMEASDESGSADVGTRSIFLYFSKAYRPETQMDNK